MKNQTSKDRAVLYVADSYLTTEGPGIPIRRPLPTRAVKLADVDPMLLLDHFDMNPAPEWGEGEGTHRHRGFEVVTYILDGKMDDRPGEGPVQHVEAGGLQQMMTGSGIVHGSAASVKYDGRVRGLQIWINLSQKDKKLKPSSRVVSAGEIPEVKTASSLTRVLVGEGSPTPLHTPVLMLDVTVKPNGEFVWDIPETFQGYAYLLEGQGMFGAERTPAEATQIVVLGEGGPLKVKAGAKGLRFFLAAGQPHREPIHWQGPFVD